VGSNNANQGAFTGKPQLSKENTGGDDLSARPPRLSGSQRKWKSLSWKWGGTERGGINYNYDTSGASSGKKLSKHVVEKA